MYLKRLELKGFKSFPNKTEVLFEKGVTSIVGPNGSGKSNISDAVRWVLGEQSIKSLRGEKLEDVIFAGTESKKAMNYCEVSLTIDNSDGKLDIDFSEVTIKRKAYKSGESEFFLNNKSCRLKDIRELLLDTGIGKDGYSIIEQGKVDEILSNNPANRRKVFDEACGISKYRYKKSEAERNLKNTKENLDRINDIYAEIEGQLEPLEKQKNKALKYIELSEELKNLEVNSYIKEIDSLNREINEVEEHSRILYNQLSIVEKDKETKEFSVEELKSNINIVEIDINKTTEYIDAIKSLSNQKESEVNLLEEKIKNVDSEKERKENEVQNIELYMKNNKEELCKQEKYKKEIEGKQIELKKLVSNISSFNMENKSKLEELNTNIESLKDEIIELLNQKNFLNSKLSSLNANLENINSRTNNINLDIKELNNNIDLNENERKQNEEQKYKKLEYSSKLKEYIKNNNEDLSKLKQQLSDIEFNINKVKMCIGECTSKVNVYTDMENHYEGFNRGVKEVLKNKSLNGICGALGQVVNVSKKYEKAIEVALGSYLQNIITENEENAKDAVSYLKKNNLGRVTFLPLNIIKGNVIDKKILNTKNNYIGIASEIVDFDQKYKSIVEYALGRTIIVNDIEIAIKFAKETNQKYKIVTLDGEIINPGGALTGGSIKTTNNILSRKRLIDELNEKIKLKNKSLEDMNVKKINIEKNINKAIISLEDIHLQLNNLEKEILVIDSNIYRDKDNLDTLVKNKQKLEKESISLKENLNYTLDRSNDITEEIKIVQLKHDENNALISKLGEEVKKVESLYEKDKNEYDNLNLESVKINQIYENTSKEIIRLNNEIEKLQISLEIYKKELLENKEYKKELVNNLKVEQTEKESLESQISDVNKKIIKLKNDKNEFNLQIDSMQSDLKSINKKYIELKEGILKLETRLERLETSYENYLSKLLENYELTLEDAIQIRDNSLIIEKRYIENIRQSIKKLGNVNLDSVDEYKEVKERYDLYNEQKMDLEESIDAIEKLISDLEENMRKEFKSNFTQINENFKFVYKRLFGGGYGELKIVDSKNILESDIEIIAQPPGKKMKNLNLLSGGEKALTAISILFSIILAKPTPFCILDEIEAPLDDANIFRFGEFLKELAKDTQFITVTHRRGTMEASDFIYGVTMQEKAISKVISLKIEQAAKFTEDII